MKKTRQCRVQPVAGYSVPKYPSHSDPDPTRYPTPVPFPFRKELVCAVAGLGLTASAFAAEEAAPEASASNPFLLKQSGLPHRTSPFGTGAPSYIQDKVAREIADKVFKAEGLNPVKGYRYDKDGVTFTADGYDKDARIGYVFGGYRSLDDDALISWRKNETDPDTLDADEIKLALRSMSHWVPEELEEEATKALELDDVKKMKDVYKSLRLRAMEAKLSLEEARKLEEEAVPRKEFIAVISQFDRRFATYGWAGGETVEQRAELQKISKIEDRKERDEKRQALQEEMAKSALDALETSVRQYIRWARSQGR